MGLQLYQVDHRSYLLDFRNLNANTDGHHPILGAQDGSLIVEDFHRRNFFRVLCRFQRTE